MRNVVQIDNSLFFDGLIVVTASKAIHGYRWASGFCNRYSKSAKHPSVDAALKAAAKTMGLTIRQLGESK